MHALLALCLLKREDWSQAIREVTEAVRLAPTSGYTHYVAGHVMLAADRHEQAMHAAHAAVQLEPDVPDYHSLVARIHLDRRRWKDALAAAENGLTFDPEHVDCNNVRAMALVKLGRRGEAGATIRQTLAIDPDDAFTHANQGWALLHERKPREAMEHFREALRIDPTMEWARAGIVEALKARNFIYRWMLAYFLYMSRLNPRAQWLIIVGGWFGAQLVRNLGNTNPSLAPFTTPLVVAYIIFAAMTWIAAPLFNLLLRLNRFGRFALSREQTIASNWIGVTLALTAALIIGYFVSHASILIDAAIITALLALPLAGSFNMANGWPRMTMWGAITVLLMIGGLHLWRIYTIIGFAPTILKMDWDAHQLLTTYGVAVLVVTLLANALGDVRVRKGRVLSS